MRERPKSLVFLLLVLGLGGACKGRQNADLPQGSPPASLAAAPVATPPKPANRDADFRALADRFFDTVYFPYAPTLGTQAGLHEYDQQLENYSRSAIESRTALLRRFAAKFDRLSAADLSPDLAADLELVRAHVQAALLEVVEIRMWEKNPDIYSSGVSNSAFVIMSRNFAPQAERLRSLIARELEMPKVFEAARQNLRNPPRIYTEIALEQLPGIISFFEKDVPSAFNEIRDAALLATFRKSNGAVIDALRKYQAFLKNELLPRSHGDFRLGIELYRRKLLHDEMVDTPLPRLLEIGYADLRKNQALFKATAARIDPKRTPAAILADLEKDHPRPDKLLQSFREVLGGLRDFMAQKRIVSLPSPVLPILEETPPFQRALTFASMDTPGPFETKAKEAFFNVTLPEPTWSAKQVREHMAGFNYGTIISTAIHEAYPGHYTQFLWVQRAPSKVRKLLGSATNAEGWAHYCEQMMLDEGYGRDNLKLRLGQIQDALLRNARFVVGVEMHTGKMTYDQGIDFFVKEGYQSRANGERETKRGTTDPTYLYYTLGKLQIQKLREDYRKLRGDRFTLLEFHDNVMKQGFPPIRILRKALLGETGSVL
jgi:uncharacterized protein (DUF885 family)